MFHYNKCFEESLIRNFYRSKSGKDVEDNLSIKTKDVIASGSLLNGIDEKGFSKNQQVKLNNKPGDKGETVL